MDYHYSANMVYPVAKYVAKFLNFLVECGLVTEDKINIIGHSLGAHVAGLTGQHMRSKVARVIALDPAAPWIGNNPTTLRFSTDSAVYTEGDAKQIFLQLLFLKLYCSTAIHTNGWKLGYGEPLAHADFFPNGGNRFVVNFSEIKILLSHFVTTASLDVKASWTL